MEMTVQYDSAAALERELDWLESLIDVAIKLYFGQPSDVADVCALPPPALDGDHSPYAAVVRGHDLDFDARLVLVLALAPHLRPQVLDPFLMRNPNLERGFTEFGGVTIGNHGGFWPTAETAAFILAGNDLDRRFAVRRLLEPDHPLLELKLIELGRSETNGTFCRPLLFNPGSLTRFTTGLAHRPTFGSDFPAKRLTMRLDWDDLVLPRQTLHDVGEIVAWTEHGPSLLDDRSFGRMIRPGYRSLFYGAPGTGKTLTASLLGKSTGLDVYRVDLSMIVSKWIGETEKNLASVFDQAEGNDWILFFDEADALFGKRTQVSGAHDRYANQEVSYILQRVEDFTGVVILASNLKGNIDDAFARRFQSMIHFPMPGPEERLRLWRGAPS